MSVRRRKVTLRITKAMMAAPVTADFLLGIPDPVARVFVRVLARVLAVATEDEISDALDVPWPWYRDTTVRPPPPGDLAGRVCEVHVLARELGGAFVLRGRPIRAGEFWGIERTRLFRERALALYDLFASRMQVRRRTRVWQRGVVPPKFNIRAAALTAAVLNTTGWSSRLLTADDVKSRVQKRRPPASVSK